MTIVKLTWYIFISISCILSNAFHPCFYSVMRWKRSSFHSNTFITKMLQNCYKQCLVYGCTCIFIFEKASKECQNLFNFWNKNTYTIYTFFFQINYLRIMTKSFINITDLLHLTFQSDSSYNMSIQCIQKMYTIYYTYEDVGLGGRVEWAVDACVIYKKWSRGPVFNSWDGQSL